MTIICPARLSSPAPVVICHPPTSDDPATPPLFTDYSYDNLGVPANPESPFLSLSAEFNPDGEGFVDLGLGGRLAEVAENGKFEVPTLRNISLIAPYMYNGVFNTLQEVLDFIVIGMRIM